MKDKGGACLVFNLLELRILITVLYALTDNEAKHICTHYIGTLELN